MHWQLFSNYGFGDPFPPSSLYPMKKQSCDDQLHIYFEQFYFAFLSNYSQSKLLCFQIIFLKKIKFIYVEPVLQSSAQLCNSSAAWISISMFIFLRGKQEEVEFSCFFSSHGAGDLRLFSLS